MEERLAQGYQNIEVTSGVEWGSSWGGGAQTQPVSDAIIVDLKSRIPQCTAVGEGFEPIAIADDPSQSAKLAAHLRDVSQDWPDTPKGWAIAMSTELDAVSRASREHNAKSLGGRVLVLLVVLAWLAATGIVAPLSWLIVGSESTSQTALLVLFSVGLVALFAHLLETVLSIRRASKLQLRSEERQ